MPLLRELCRHLFSHLPGWGYQAVIFGSGAEAQALIERSRRELEVGINPVAVIDPRAEGQPFLCGLPIVSSIEAAAAAASFNPFKPTYGLLTVAAASSAEMVRLVSSPESIIFFTHRIDLKSLSDVQHVGHATQPAAHAQAGDEVTHRQSHLPSCIDRWSRLFTQVCRGQLSIVRY
jgi:FlaA1/EpsC-like NDP-sugar epimerase